MSNGFYTLKTICTHRSKQHELLWPSMASSYRNGNNKTLLRLDCAILVYTEQPMQPKQLQLVLAAGLTLDLQQFLDRCAVLTCHLADPLVCVQVYCCCFHLPQLLAVYPAC